MPLRTRQIVPPLTLFAAVILATACDDPSDAPLVGVPANPEPLGLAVLGDQSHTLDGVHLTEIGTVEDGLAVPRDLAFDPWAEQPTLWVANRADDSTTIFFEPDTAESSAVHLIDPYALHFMEEVSSLAFGAEDRFGSCQESRNTYNNRRDPNDFMGPSLWSSDLDVYARTNPDAVAALGFDLGSHLDMQHESPLCMGIAWEVENAYWIFEGLTGSIARVDFAEDHGPGFDDHADGVMIRYAEGQVQRVPDVPSHLVFDHDRERLYIADTGNARIAALHVSTTVLGEELRVRERGTTLQLATARMKTVFEHDALVRPSGLAQAGNVLFVGDNATGRIWGVSLATGQVLDYLDTGLSDGALMGIEVGPDGDLWIVDAVDNRVLRISPR